MRDIAIYGAGGLGREIACVLKKINMVTPTWNLLGFFDDGLEVGTKNEYGWHECAEFVYRFVSPSDSDC